MAKLSERQIRIVGAFTMMFAQLEFMAVERGHFDSKEDGDAKRIVGPMWDSLITAVVKESESGSGAEKLRGFLKSAELFATNSPPGNLFNRENLLYFRLSERDRTKAERWQKGELSQAERLSFTFDLLKNVRNNLFHGNKSIDDPQLTEDRLTECIPILQGALELVAFVPRKAQYFW